MLEFQQSVDMEEMMKIWYIVAACALFYSGLVKAQYYQPVENNFEEIDADVDANATDVKEDNVLKDKLIDTSVHFAQRNKDLAIAKTWLQQEFSRNEGKNIVVSPLSFYLSAVLLANGVVDEGLIEFSNLFSVLRLSDVGRKINEYMYREKDSTFINVSLWGKAFSDRYQKMMSEQFGAEVWGIKESTSAINDWAATRTKGVIKKIAPVKDVAENELYVGSIAYFKGQLPLTTYSVTEENFNGKKYKVATLSAQVEADYYEDNEKQAIRLACGHDDLLTILLPKEDVDFDEFVEKLDVYNLIPEFDERGSVNLSLPVLNFDYGTVFAKNVYDTFNISRIFMKENYSFAKMVSFDEDIYLRDLFMVSKIDIGAQGTPSSSTDKKNIVTKYTFNANRPFVFIVNKGDFIGTFVWGN